MRIVFRSLLLIILGAGINYTAAQPDSSAEASNAAEKDQRESESAIEEVVVSGRRNSEKSEIRPDTELLLNVAGAGIDPLAAVLSLPGVTFASDYSSEPAVRGSSPSDNGYYIDLIPARYIFHIFGNSIFNHNLIHSFDLYPAAFSSQYGNATGAIIDVQLREPRDQDFTTALDASFITSGAMIESRIGENQAFYLSYRRSLIDLFIRDEEDVEDEDSGIGLDQIPVSDDYQFKYVWYLNKNNQIAAIGAGASDKVGVTFRQNSNAAMIDPDFAGPAKLKMQFDSQGVVWDWVSDSAQNTNKLIVSHTQDLDDITYGTGQYIRVETQRRLLKNQWSFHPVDSHEVTFGLSSENTDYSLWINAKLPACSDFDADCPTIDAPLFSFADEFSLRSKTAFLEDLWEITENFSVRLGVHHLSDNYLKQTTTEFRTRADYTFNDQFSIHLAHGDYSQLPKPDEMAPQVGSANLEYIESTHNVIGFKHELDNKWSWQVELYHKNMNNLPLSLNPATDPDYLQRYSNDSNGEAYGVELLIDKGLTDKLYGWLAVSVAHTERENERTGDTKEFQFDKPVIVNLVGNYKLTENLMAGMKWSLQSGALYTPIVDVRQNVNDPTVLEPVYGELNSERLPFYHRLDLRVEYSRTTGYGMWSVFVDVLNAYNSRNTQGYSFAPNGNDTVSSAPDGFGTNVPVQRIDGLGWFPSIGAKIQF